MKKTSIRMVAAVVLAVFCAGLMAGCSFRKQSSSGPKVQQNHMWLEWKTYPADDVEFFDNQFCRLSGIVLSLIRQSGSQGYYLECNGIQVPVQVQTSWDAAADLPMRNMELMILGIYHPGAEVPFIQEVYRFPLDGTDWEAWEASGGYYFALENLFRQLAVTAPNGKHMPALNGLEWEQALDSGKNPLVTSKSDILTFLGANAHSIRALWWGLGVLLALGIGLAVWRLSVKFGWFVRRCPECGLPVSQCTCSTEPALCPICGKPLPECPGHGDELPPPESQDGICPHCGLPRSHCTCTTVICPRCKRPKDQCVCTTPPAGTALLIDGIPLDRSDKTVMLSPWALKVIRGGESTGAILPLPKMGTLIGRERNRVPGAFIFLDMKDRPQLERQCSRKYAKISARGEVLDIEVVNESGNDVRVDGRAISAKGEVLQARTGSRIELEPDWEFEVGEW